MIQYAFRIKNYQVSGPDWMRSSRWNVLARLPEGVPQDKAPEMMQALLAERFQLKVHHEKREQNVYALEVAKGGSKLEAAPPSNDEPAASSGAAAPGLFPDLSEALRSDAGREAPGTVRSGRGGRRGPASTTTTGADGTTARMSRVTAVVCTWSFQSLRCRISPKRFTPFLDKPVVDATGLKGAYRSEFSISHGSHVHDDAEHHASQWTARSRREVSAGAAVPATQARAAAAVDLEKGVSPGAALANGGGDDVPIFRALQKLGLKLEARKAPFHLLDHRRSLRKLPTDNSFVN